MSKSGNSRRRANRRKRRAAKRLDLQKMHAGLVPALRRMFVRGSMLRYWREHDYSAMKAQKLATHLEARAVEMWRRDPESAPGLLFNAAAMLGTLEKEVRRLNLELDGAKKGAKEPA